MNNVVKHRCVLAVKASTDKAGLEAMAYQIAQLTTLCVDHDAEVIDVIVTFGSTKDLVREVKRLDAKKRFDLLLVYSPSQIARTKLEYDTFAHELLTNFKIKVGYLRSPN